MPGRCKPTPEPTKRPAAEEAGETWPLLQSGQSATDDSAWRVAASCAGFLADSYDLFTIDLVVLILQLEYGEGLIGTAEQSMMVSMMVAGVVVGQLSFGFIADMVGRKWAFVMTAALTILGAVACALCMQGLDSLSLPLQLALCRFLLGLGVGGEYPLSATVTAEAAGEAKERGQVMALVVSMQGWGMLLSSAVAMGAVSLGLSLEATWRLLLAFGALPSAVAFCMRWSLEESHLFEKAREAKAGHSSAIETVMRFWHLLLGTAVSWMLMNMFQYSIGSFKSSILAEVMHGVLPAADEVMQHARFSGVVSFFAILGFGAGMLLVGKVSRYEMQFWGFLAIAGLFTVVSCLSISSVPSTTSLVVFLGLLFFMNNAGPNLTTYILPAELFPTSVRATCHGISAASGKLGAFFGTAAFPHLQDGFGMVAVYAACGCVALLGAVITYFFTPRETSELETLDEHVRQQQQQAGGEELKGSSKDCAMCGGSGKRGLLGPTGFGLFTFPCARCSDTSLW